MNYILFDESKLITNLLPLTYTRPISEIRAGILTIKQKWDKYLKTKTSYKTQEYLQKKYNLIINTDNTIINSSVLPDKEIISEIKKLQNNQIIIHNDTFIAIRLNKKQTIDFFNKKNGDYKVIQYKNNITQITNTWDIFKNNDTNIKTDFNLITKRRKSQQLDKTVNIIGNNIFIEKGAKIKFVTLNTETGPIYIGKNAEIMENSVIRGPFAICEHSTVKMSAKIYGPTTIGPHSKVGGELNNVVIFGYTNKAHDGFIGNSVIGEWCNIGADTNNSNLKNNYAQVKLWSYNTEKFENTKLQFCGLIMGDHSKTGINTMFNTGTVVGVNANIFGTDFPRNFIPSFSWGGAKGFVTYKTNKAFDVADKVFKRRNLEFNKTEQDILSKVFEITKKYRKN